MPRRTSKSGMMRPIYLILLVFSLSPAYGQIKKQLPRSTQATSNKHVYQTKSPFHKVVRYYDKVLKSKRVVFTKVGPYQIGGVTVARFLLEDTKWLAIQVYRNKAGTFIGWLPKNRD